MLIARIQTLENELAEERESAEAGGQVKSVLGGVSTVYFIFCIG